MNDKNSPRGYTYSFDKKKKPVMNQFILGVISGFLAFLGLAIIVMVVSGGSNPFGRMFATDTPTPTMTFTPSPFPTETPTMEGTEGPTITNTPSGPQNYQIQDGDTFWSIAEAFNVGIDVLLAYNNLTNEDYAIPGTTIVIPPSDAELPTATPFPTDFQRGTSFEYTVQYGDSLVSIADKFNDDLTQLMSRNGITNATINDIQAGDVLTVRYNIMTRTPTIAPTSTINLVTPRPSSTATP
jgi:LysM repeat protein